MIKAMILAAAALTMSATSADAQTMIEKNNIKVENHLMTPEALWAMGRIGGAEASPNGKQVVYQVGYYSVKENKSHQMLFIMNANGKNQKALTTDAKSETDAPYCSSKFAIEGFVNSLRQELLILKNVDIKICLIEPGAFATGFNKENNDKKYSWMKNASYFKPQIEKIKYYEEKFWNFVETSKFEKIIKEYINAVENNRPKFRYFAPFSQWFIVKICTILGL